MTTNRRAFLSSTFATVVAARINGFEWDNATTPGGLSNGSFATVKQIDAGVLNVGYVDEGLSNAPAVILLHGWPYDIHAFEEVVPALVAKGYRVIVPYLRGFGTTSFLSARTPRKAQQSAIAADVIDLMNSLSIDTAIIAGFDWGSRTAAIVAALWPQRCKALVAVSGYLVVNRAANLRPLPPRAELGWWYQYYFATERGRTGYAENRYDFNKLIWRIASPKWAFDTATYDRTAASFNTPDHVDIVIDNYRWRLSLTDGESRYDALEQRLLAAPPITVPAITIGSDFDGTAADGAAYARKFTGKHSHVVLNGIGHNVPQEAPRAFVDAIVRAGSYA